MKVALVHDWLVGHRGGERVLLEIARMFPNAPIYTLVYQPERVHRKLQEHPIITSFIQKLPFSFRKYLPLFPKAVENWDFSTYDLIVSTSHCVVKGIRTHAKQKHISYIHTPMRYLWDQMPEYLPPFLQQQGLVKTLQYLTTPLRQWDIISAQRPTHLIANSQYVAKRIQRYWQRQAEVIYPPVDTDFFTEGATSENREGYLVVSALVPYKRVRLAVELATQKNLKLTVIGEGSEKLALQRIAGPTVTFLGGVSKHLLRQHYQRAKALLFCGVEDFGIAPVEAMAAGCPVIAFNEGGVCESLVPSKTGLFFNEPTAESLAQALSHFEKQTFLLEDLQQRARDFHQQAFALQLNKTIHQVLGGQPSC